MLQKVISKLIWKIRFFRNFHFWNHRKFWWQFDEFQNQVTRNKFHKLMMSAFYWNRILELSIWCTQQMPIVIIMLPMLKDVENQKKLQKRSCFAKKTMPLSKINRIGTKDRNEILDKNVSSIMLTKERMQFMLWFSI